MVTYNVVLPDAYVGLPADFSTRMFVWFHTKIDMHALQHGIKPDDGVMGEVKAITPLDHNQVSVDVEFTAADHPDRFELRPLVTPSDSGGLLKGFSAFFKR